jgi:translation initiation factor 3 subunit C
MALHNKVMEARDLLKKTHIGQMITMQHVDNQILYNRALAQIGMAFFRLGKIEQSHEVLVEIFYNPRFRELLAQGINRHFEKSTEQEAEEKRRQVPAHMAINLQTLESTHYITSMLIEIPMLSENQHSMSKTVISRQYRRLIELYDNKQAFVLSAE